MGVCMRVLILNCFVILCSICVSDTYFALISVYVLKFTKVLMAYPLMYFGGLYCKSDQGS